MSIISRYKDKNILPPGLASLYTSRTLILVAAGFIGLFLPVFLLQQYQSLQAVIWFYFWTWFLYLLLAAPGARLMNVFGITKVMIYSLPFLAFFYLALYFFENDVLVWTVVAGLSLTLYRMLYWVPYHTDFASFSEGKNRGKQISLLDSISTFLGILTPFISGFLIMEFGFKPVFVIVVVLILTSMLPLYFLPEVKEKFTWSYQRTWQEFFAGSNRKMMLAYIGEGAENWIGGGLWPIFIWQLLEGRELQVGILTSAINLIAVILNLAMGDYTDRFNKRKLMRAGSILYSLGWIAKMFVTTAFQLFIASTYHSFALILLRTPFSALIYEKAADSGHFLDEYSTLREMYLQFGRIIVMTIILALLNFLSLNLVFALAAVASLLVNLLPKHGLYEKAFNF